jgi:hypothetical protein
MPISTWLAKGDRNMKGAYPAVFSPAEEGGYDVYIPD